MSEEEYKESLTYNTNLVWKYTCILMIVSYLIERYGVQVYLGEKELSIDFNERFLESPLDERKEIYRLIERKVKVHRKKKYEIHKLAFKHEDFQDDAYYKSLMKMADALLHVYGTDRSSTVTLECKIITNVLT